MPSPPQNQPSARAIRRKRKRDEERKELDDLREQAGSSGGGGAYGAYRNDNQRPHKSQKKGQQQKPQSQRPHWIKDDADWAVVESYKVPTYKEAVGKWRDANADVDNGTCFWKHHKRQCMNRSCPACHPRDKN